MLELDALYWVDKNGITNNVSIVDACVEKELAEELRKALGIPDYRLTSFVREMPAAFCRAVFQQWYNERSTTSRGYPINWITLLKALDEVGLKDVAKKAHTALLV